MNNKLVNIIISKDIVLADGYIYKYGSVFRNVKKYIDLYGRTCYEPENTNHTICISNKDDLSVVELGFMASEIFQRIDSLAPLDIDELKEILEKIKEFSDESENLKAEIEDLRKQCNAVSKIGTF